MTEAIKNVDGRYIVRPEGVSVTIEPRPDRRGDRVLIDDKDVSALVTEITVYGDPQRLTTATLSLFVGRLYAEDVDVQIDTDTEELLVKLGWTRPGDQP